MRLLAADAWRFVERTGRFRKLPTPALPGSGQRVYSQPRNVVAPLSLQSVNRCKGIAFSVKSVLLEQKKMETMIFSLNL